MTITEALSPDALEAMDLPHIEPYNRLVDAEVARRIAKPESDKKAARIKEAQGWRLRPDLGALCMDGDPLAPVVYLQANPSYGDAATRETQYQPHTDWPLSVAGPHIHPATRDYYRKTVFLHVLKEGVTLDALSRRMLKVELCPWASKKWPGNGKLDAALSKFPSRQPIAQFVEQLVERGALFILARAWDPWLKAVPSLAPLEGTRVFKSRTPASGLICRSFYPDGWDQLVAALHS
ncbi:MAG: hypothetical protein EON54_20515 [Alcaligenaceae bacterium]|nr:MAG: hypothetical protein EON54_20515 [Alcaligenaceae bacterium]